MTDQYLHAFQRDTAAFLVACFGEDFANDIPERRNRFMEEAIELFQSVGGSAQDVAALAGYVFGRPAGEPWQEVGGTMTTLAALCSSVNVKMAEVGWKELKRISAPEVIERIRTKHASRPKNSPLPGSPDGTPVVDLTRVVEALKAERDESDQSFAQALERANSALEAIGDYAHNKSTGPAVWDPLWEVRRMAYEGVQETLSIANSAPAIDAAREQDRALLAMAPATTQAQEAAVGPMAKMAQALREKAAAERSDFDRRVQSGEWGPMPGPETEADDLPDHVAEIEGDDAVRELRWNKRIGAFNYPVGTKLYAAPQRARDVTPLEDALLRQGAARAGKLVARGMAAPQAAVGVSDEQIEAIALARYKVVPAHGSMFWSHAVVAGDGTQQLYTGREVECQNMAAKFAGAFLDGAFLALSATKPEAPAMTAELVAAAQRGQDGVFDLLKDWHLINKDGRASKRLWQIGRNLEGIFGCMLRGDFQPKPSVAPAEAPANEGGDAAHRITLDARDRWS